jgi:hypothetical protein
VSSTQTGTTEAIGGSFSLTMLGEISPPISTTATGAEMTAALNSMAVLDDVTVTRYETINNGAMFLIKFANHGSNYPLLEYDDRDVTGTAVQMEASIYQLGDMVSGTFVIATNVGLPANQVYSDPIPYNATAEFIAAAFEKMNASYVPMTVTRTESSTMVNAFTWTLVFPLSAGNVPYHDVNNVGTTGYHVDVSITTQQDGQAPTVMKVATSASSPLVGYFTLSLNGSTTVPIAHDASAVEVQAAVAALPAAGVVQVSRLSTGAKDFNTWGGVKRAPRSRQGRCTWPRLIRNSRMISIRTSGWSRL